jgi:hypothetical protein
MASDAHKVVASAALISVGVGSANAVFKNQKPPSSRFLIGSGVAFLILSMMADGEPELAKGLAIAVASTVVLGEGGGVLSYINHGEMDTTKKSPAKKVSTPTKAAQPARPVKSVTVRINPSNGFRPDTITPVPGMSHPVNNGNAYATE